MKDMQNSDSHELEIRDFVNDCRNLYKISLSSVKILLYSEMSNNFLPEVLLRITSEIENVTNLYNQIAQLQGKFHQHSSLQDSCSLLMYSYEVWIQRIVFQLDALLSSIKKIVHKLLKLYTDDSLVTCIRLITFYNSLIVTYGVISKDMNHTAKSSILNQESRKKLTIPRILKIVAHDRTEECAYVLIKFLIMKYNDIDKINSLTSDLTDVEEDNISKNDDEDVQHESDNTSILIYKTLTQYDSPPRNTSATSIRSKNSDKKPTQDIATATFIASERKRLDVLFATIISTNPHELLTEQELAVSKRTGCVKICSKVKQKLVKIYEQILWQNIGIVGEHMLLWWTDFGLGKKNQLISQKFNAWLKQYFSTENMHITVQPTIYGLLDCLCCFITSTSWDELFTQSLIYANNQHSRHDFQNIGLGTKTGHLFSDMLYDVVFLTNSCEGSNWTQQDLENLPLVEQIPLLHRLDHTIHSVRLWAMGRAKYLTNCWNMEQFFRVTHVDVNASLYALSLLKLTQNVISLDHENSHFVVCSKMKAKLVSEVNVNIEKLHEVPHRSLKILASVCKITSLAYLKICFPPELYWQQQNECAPKIASDYVEKYLDEILKPVLLASQNLPLPVQKPVSKLILEILCEAWLDHIYNFRIKFSKWGAIQLLMDFGAIPVWIKEKITINNEIQSFLTSDEILRRCEGVGRLLLRHPGESIVMGSEQDIFQIENSKTKELENVPETLMPPEMYVPNQEKWLELRLNEQKLTITTCC